MIFTSTALGWVGCGLSVIVILLFNLFDVPNAEEAHLHTLIWQSELNSHTHTHKVHVFNTYTHEYDISYSNCI